jgi:phosphatidylglycerol:prolipoprotein diacylglycerol transferase
MVRRVTHIVMHRRENSMLFPEIDPVIFQIGPVALRWYGLAYVVGLLGAWWLARRIAAQDRLWKDNQSPITPLDLDDFLLWSMLGIVAGGRLGYVLFYDLGNTLADPASIIRIWDGGMSFHGGMLGVLVAMILFARSRKLPVLSLIDVVSSVAPIGLFFGRIANFINAELWGRTTDVPWGVVFPGIEAGPLPRHPSQLYEAVLEGLVLLIVLQVLIWKFGALKKPLMIGGLFFAGYGLSRIIVEFYRVPDADIGYLLGDWLTMGMVLSLPMLIAGIVGAIWAQTRARTKVPS